LFDESLFKMTTHLRMFLWHDNQRKVANKLYNQYNDIILLLAVLHSVKQTAPLITLSSTSLT